MVCRKEFTSLYFKEHKATRESFDLHNVSNVSVRQTPYLNGFGY